MYSKFHLTYIPRTNSRIFTNWEGIRTFCCDFNISPFQSNIIRIANFLITLLIQQLTCFLELFMSNKKRFSKNLFCFDPAIDGSWDSHRNGGITSMGFKPVLANTNINNKRNNRGIFFR